MYSCVEKLHREIELSSDIYLSASMSEGKLSTGQGLHFLWPVKTIQV